MIALRKGRAYRHTGELTKAALQAFIAKPTDGVTSNRARRVCGRHAKDTNSFAKASLRAHNIVRCQYGAPMLSWSAALADSARAPHDF